MALKSSIRGISGIVSILLVFAIVSSMPPTNGALRKPMYAPGDKWVYVLDGSLGGSPGFNASQGTFHLALVGLVYVSVIGSGIVLVNNGSLSPVRGHSPPTRWRHAT